MSENNVFIIDDGCQEFVFKNNYGDVFARFTYNPSDVGILSRYDTVADFFSKATLDMTEDNATEKVVELENQIKEQLNILCAKNVSDGIFLQYTPLTLFANGDFYCEVALEKIGEAIEKSMKTRLAKKKAKIKKVLGK